MHSTKEAEVVDRSGWVGGFRKRALHHNLSSTRQFRSEPLGDKAKVHVVNHKHRSAESKASTHMHAIVDACHATSY